MLVPVFFFWVVAAKLYSVEEVGQATALISSLGLIMLISRLGFDLSLIRFGLNDDQSKVFNTSLFITTLAAFAIAFIYSLIPNLSQVSLTSNFSYFALFTIITVFNSITLITGNMFCALRKGYHYFIQTVIVSMRLFLLFLLVNFKGFGIFLALGICYILSSLFSLWILNKEVKINIFEFDKKFVKASCKFSLGSFLSNILVEYLEPAIIL